MEFISKQYINLFSVFKAALKQTFIDGYFTTDISAKINQFQLKNQEENI